MAGGASGTARDTAQLWLEAALVAMARQGRTEWFGSPPHLARLTGPKAQGFPIFPKDFRPARAEAGQALMAGVFTFAGESLQVGEGGEPWNRPSPSRAFAEALHGFDWLRDLAVLGPDGAREGLRLIEEWRLVFGRWSSFAWGGEVLDRRVVNTTCALGPIVAVASEAEVEMLAELLARQSRQLLLARDPAWRAAERTSAAALAGSAIAGRAGEALMARALPRLEKLVPRTVLADGGHVSRSPEAGMELLFDLLALDDGLDQRGVQTPEVVLSAIDRLKAALRFFTLPDGRLACFQGGEESEPARIAAARAIDEEAGSASPPAEAPYAGYQRLIGRTIQVMMDVGRPAPDPYSITACAQPGAIEVVCGADRLITNSGWSPRAARSQALRLTDGGSTVALAHESAGAPLGGWMGRMLGPRLAGGARHAGARRAATETGIWVDFTHDGWAALGLKHDRRLFLDLAADELRGEDQFTPIGPASGSRVISYAVHFHLPPEVEAVVARDNRSVLLRGPSAKGWWLRNDAVDVRVEPAVHFRGGQQLSSRQVVMLGHLRADRGGRVRWKLAAVE
jgi:uncharacterized heparinase superfamily protein